MVDVFKIKREHKPSNTISFYVDSQSKTDNRAERKCEYTQLNVWKIKHTPTKRAPRASMNTKGPLHDGDPSLL